MNRYRWFLGYISFEKVFLAEWFEVYIYFLFVTQEARGSYEKVQRRSFLFLFFLFSSSMLLNSIKLSILNCLSRRVHSIKYMYAVINESAVTLLLHVYFYIYKRVLWFWSNCFTLILACNTSLDLTQRKFFQEPDIVTPVEHIDFFFWFFIYARLSMTCKALNNSHFCYYFTGVVWSRKQYKIANVITGASGPTERTNPS